MPKLRSRKTQAKMSDEEWLAYQRAREAAYQRKRRARFTMEEKRAARRAEDARCYDWQRILLHVEKEEESGCWAWRGPYTIYFGLNVYPIVRVGRHGQQRADVVVWSLTHKKPLPHGCHLVRSCGNIACVAEAHALVTNKAVERARRRHHEQEKLAGRKRESGDPGRESELSQRGGRTATG